MNEKLNRILRDRDREIAAIQANPELTQRAKNDRIAAAREGYQQEHEQAKAEERARLEKRVSDTRRSVFHVDTTGAIGRGEEEKVREVYRNLWSATEMMTDDVFAAKDTLGKMLDQSERTGDPMLGLVAYHRALDIAANNTTALSDLGMQELVNRYLADKPQAAKALENYGMAVAEANEATSFEGRFSGAMGDRVFDE